MNEMDLLERVRADVEINPTALVRARRRLLRQAIAPVVRRRRPTRRVVGAVAVAAAMAGLAVLVLPGPQGAEPAAAAVLDRAARLAAAEEVAAPGQWLHVRLETTRPSAVKAVHYVQERWVPGGSSGVVVLRDRESVWTHPLDRPAIYTDADASVEDLHEWLGRDSGDLRGDDAAFERAGEVMFDSTAPPAFKARLLEAIALIEGVHVVTDQARFHGHDAVVVGRSESSFETRFVFDSRTGALLGVEGVGHGGAAEMSYSTLFTSNVVDALPERVVRSAAS